MSAVAALLFICFVFMTSMFSGVFGTAGGLILLWGLLLILPPATAIAIQGFIQLTANASRAWVSRSFIDPRISAIATLGLLASAFIFVFVDYSPSLVNVSIAIGLLPVLVWIPKSWLRLDASRPFHAFLAGFFAGAMNIGIGTSGPVIDIFFIRTSMDRRVVIATKAFLQTISHLIKIIFYMESLRSIGLFEWVAIMGAAPAAFVGTALGAVILGRLTDVSFRKWTRLVVTLVGGFYLTRGILLLM